MPSDIEWNRPDGWFKSSRSNGEANCVEVNLTNGEQVGIRDTKAGGTGPVLVVARSRYRTFLNAVADGEFGN